jgi:signal transduction histidine kinase
LTFKIMAAVMMVVAILLALHSYLVVQREVELFRVDMNLHAYLLGSVLASSIADIWKTSSPDRVERIIEDANQSERLVQVRWVWFDVSSDDPSAPRADIEDRASLERGQELLFPEYSYRGSDYHLAYFPVRVDSTRLSALELSQPLTPMRSYIRNTIIRKIALFITFLLVGGGLVWWLGIRLVGRPVHSLVDQTRAVGRGDLNARNDLEHKNDEIGELALGFNAMVKGLRLAHDRLEEETSRRLSAMEQLSHAERLATVGKLASGLAHELGTPLNVVAGRAKMISSEDMERAEISDSATVIQNQAERMTGIIRQLLDFARSKSLEKDWEELAKPINDVIHMLTPIAAQNHIDLVLQPGDGTPQVRIDTGQIQQVLSNLIINAIHAMPDGGRITICYGQRSANPPADHGGAKAEYAFVEVIDTGVGIAKENLAQIFTPFFSTKQVGEGTGLGLSIAHGIVKDHGGWLTVESTEGKGTIFSVYLPIGEGA